MSMIMLVAVGGAVGSVLRYLIGLATVAAWGSAFPWGTILINIAGSFVIGLVGAATLEGGMLPASPALRAFVMVGLCGGFTTFSSFSLQTLELVRGGRTSLALLNVALSVLLCLAAVLAGYQIGERRPAQSVSGQGHAAATGEVILVVLDRPEDASAQLATAVGLLQRAGQGTLRVLALPARAPAPGAPTEEVYEAAPADEAVRMRALRQTFDAMQAADPAIRAEWLSPRGDAGGIVADLGRQADMVLVGRPHGGRSQRVVHAALFECGRPVLVLPPGSGKVRFRTVALAWKPDEHARKAVQDAMPLLREATRRCVLQAGAGAPDACEPLASAGLSFDSPDIAASLAGPGGGHDTGAALLRAAEACHADLLVMGAYAHGEIRERLLGGVTRSMLEQASLPVLMRH
ncbi:fluoride efflux transporter CrcB [Lichenicoccus sp.]|uniref:fluoride efflux transporter CrcB n=1 Tax=Lichenicoccus sp. TaxID=2781899 RepID=UPI003D0B9384